MRRIRYLIIMLVLLTGSISIWAQDDFNPADPPEPGQPPMPLKVTVLPAEAGSVSGAGSYAEGTKVTLKAYTNTGFKFVNWTNDSGVELSTSATYIYTKGTGHEQLTANYTFEPSNPSEPQEPSQIMFYQLQLNTTEGGTASGGGQYIAGKKITLKANPQSGFDFAGWYDYATGELLSNTTSFSYTTTAKHRVFEARFEFNPNSPSEPIEPVLRRTVTATATEGGTINYSTGYVLIGSSISFKATVNSGYKFLGWYLNGIVYTTLSSFSYTVTDSYYQNFEARFEFNPASPSEPNMPTTTKHSFYIMNKVTKPGMTVKFPIYLSSVKTLKDMTFQLEFPEELTPDFTKVEMSERATGYNISYSKQDEKNYVFTLMDGEVPAGNATLLMFTIYVAEDIITNLDYPIKINLVEVTEEDNTVTTASTRNGRISVYKNGDTNGDDTVDALDASLILQYAAHKIEDNNTDFIKEVADTNDGDEVDALDASLVLQHAAKKINLNEINKKNETK